VRLDGVGQLKNPMTSSGNETTTFGLVAKCLSNGCHPNTCNVLALSDYGYYISATYWKDTPQNVCFISVFVLTRGRQNLVMTNIDSGTVLCVRAIQNVAYDAKTKLSRNHTRCEMYDCASGCRADSFGRTASTTGAVTYLT
jgi:hypothetical protein